jgi:hypothetical protein
MVNRVAIRWSRAAKVPSRSCRLRVGWPTRIPANGLAESHLGVGQEPQFLELGRIQQVRLIHDDHDAAVPLVGFGGQQVGGLGHQLGLEVAGLVAERADDGDVEAAGAEGGVGDVDDLVAGRVEGRDGGADGHGLACADVPGDHSERGLDDAKADPGDRLGVRLAGEKVAGRDGFAERGAGQAEVGGPRCRAHRSSLPSAASRVKSIFAVAPASSSCAAATMLR